MSSKKHKHCKETCKPDWAEEVHIPEKKVKSKVTETPFLLFLILILLIIVFGKEKIISSIKMLLAGFQSEAEDVVCC